MNLSPETIKEFKKLYKNRFGIELSDEEALRRGTNLLRLCEIVYKPLTDKEREILMRRENKQ